MHMHMIVALLSCSLLYACACILAVHMGNSDHCRSLVAECVPVTLCRQSLQKQVQESRRKIPWYPLTWRGKAVPIEPLLMVLLTFAGINAELWAGHISYRYGILPAARCSVEGAPLVKSSTKAASKNHELVACMMYFMPDASTVMSLHVLKEVDVARLALISNALEGGACTEGISAPESEM